MKLRSSIISCLSRFLNFWMPSRRRLKIIRRFKITKAFKRGFKLYSLTRIISRKRSKKARMKSTGWTMIYKTTNRLSRISRFRPKIWAATLCKINLHRFKWCSKTNNNSKIIIIWRLLQTTIIQRWSTYPVTSSTRTVLWVDPWALIMTRFASPTNFKMIMLTPEDKTTTNTKITRWSKFRIFLIFTVNLKLCLAKVIIINIRISSLLLRKIPTRWMKIRWVRLSKSHVLQVIMRYLRN